MGNVRGYVAVLTGAAFLGAAATLGTLVLLTTSVLAAMLAVQGLGALVLLPFARRGRPRRTDLRLFLPFVVVGGAAAPVLWFLGLDRTTPAEAALLSNLEALFTITLAYAFLGERLHRVGYVGIAALLAGAVAVTTNFDFVGLSFSRNLPGNLLIIAAMLCWGVDNNLARILLARYDTLNLAFYKLSLGTLLVVPVAIALGTSFALALDVVPVLLLLAVTSVSLVIWLFYTAFREIGAMRAGALISTSALFGVAVAFAVFGTSPSAVQMGGGLLMVAGTFLIARRGGTAGAG